MSKPEYLFPVIEIEQMILSYLNEPRHYFNLVQVNKYFYEMIHSIPLYLELYKCKKQYDCEIIIYFDKKCQFFWIACLNNFLRTAQFFYEKYSKRIDIHKNYNLVFRTACEHGYLDFAKWLYDLDPIKSNFPKKNNVFSTACIYGQLELAKWVYSWNGFIDIHDKDEYIFRMTCNRGHLEVAKWLCELDPNNPINIRAINDFAFRLSITNKNIHIFRWLCEKYEKDINAN